jgi:hypothetical protein
MEGESVRRQLEEAHPRWRVWRNGDVAYAWLAGASPPPVLRDTTWASLGRRIGAYENMWELTHNYKMAMHAAELAGQET